MKRSLLTLGLCAAAVGSAFAAESYEQVLARALRGYNSHHEVPVDVVRGIANDYGRTFSSVFRDLRFYEEQGMTTSATTTVRPATPVVNYEATPVRPVDRTPQPRYGSGADDLLPPNPEPGHCYARALVPAQYKTEYRQVLKSQGAERVNVKPAQYQTVEQTVMVREAGTRYKVIDPVYTWVDEKVEVRPATTRLVEIPAKYKTVTERVVDVEAHQVWKKGKGPFQQISNATGEIMCLVTVPATYKTITKKVLVTPATVKEVSAPAEYKTVRRKVLKTEGKVVQEEIPAQYDTIKVTQMIAPPTYDRSVSPDEYQNVSYKQLVRPAQMEWREILCETNVNVATIAKIQRALNAKGYSAGPADGVIGAQTRNAMIKFQKDNGLASGAITYKTLQRLGLRAEGGVVLD